MSEFREKLLTIQIAAKATPTRRPVTVERENMEERWSKDMPAYRRLRKDGVQPKGIDGAAKVEATADTVEQVEGRPDARL